MLKSPFDFEFDRPFPIPVLDLDRKSNTDMVPPSFFD